MRAVRVRRERDAGPRSLARRSAPLRLEGGTPSIKERIDVMLHDDAKFDAAAAIIPPKLPGTVGRRRTFPDYVWPMWVELRAIFGSHTAVERELGRGGRWQYIRSKLRQLHPDLLELPRRPPRRQDFAYMRDTYMTNDDALNQALQCHIEVATAQAKEGGNLGRAAGGSFTHPAIENAIYGDGTVIALLYSSKTGERLDKRTGEIRQVRHDPDARLYTVGGGNQVRGIKVAIVSTRREEGRFILGVGHVEKDEAAVALDLLRKITPQAPDAQALVWDMALRGKHINVIQTELGLVAVVGVVAKTRLGTKGRDADAYVPKTVDLDDRTVKMPDGSSRTLLLAAVDGWLAIKTFKENGEPHYEPLTYTRIQRRSGKGRFRFYAQVRLPEEYGGGLISIRLFQNAEDDARGINRPENVRAIPPGSVDFKRLHVLRPDAESINRGLDDSFFLRRASAKGWRRVMVDLLGHARMVNALTLARCRARPPMAVAA